MFLVEPPPLPSVNIAPTHTYPAFEAIRESGAFEGIAAGGSMGSMRITEQGDNPRGRSVQFVSHDFFTTLGVGPVLGRAFTEDEDQRGAPPVAVLSHRYWRTAFNADPDVLSRTVLVSQTPVTIIGVLPREFRGLTLADAPDLYLPLRTVSDLNDESPFNFFESVAWIRVVGRVRPDGTAEAAAAQLNASIGERRGDFFLTSVETATIPAAVRPAMAQFTTLLSTTVGLLLAIGCLTVGMLLLVRTEDRRNDLAVCMALGATRSRLVCGIAVEAAVLCALGAVLAVPVASWLLSGLRLFQLPGGIDIDLLELSLGPGTWLVTGGAALTATCVIALLASLLGLAGNTSVPLQSRAIAARSPSRRRTRSVLVAGQIAVSVVLATGAGLFMRSLVVALSLNPNLDSAAILTASLPLASNDYTAQSATAFFEELRGRLQQNAFIESVAVTRNEGGRAPGYDVTVDGVGHRLPDFLARIAVDEGYFPTIGLPVIGGRPFSTSDTTGSLPVVIVSESFGRLIADGGDPVGHRISETVFRQTETGPEATEVVAEIVGVVPDLITDVNTTEPLVIYHPLAQRNPAPAGTLVLRAADDPGVAVRETLATINAIDPQAAPGTMLTLDEQIAQQMGSQQFGVYVLSGLGTIALLLTALGTYVLTASMVVARRREMSIRGALGASALRLGRLVLRDTARVVCIGLAAGLVLTWAGSSMIRALLYGVEPFDPMVLITVSVLVLGLALAVSLRPAFEATRLDLMRSLREE
jgi:predicted permease